jgi:predicted ATPase
MIAKIEAVNYRCLSNVSQALGNFHVVGGPNGSGKTTFLEVPYILGLFARDGLDSVWSATRARAFEELTFCGGGTSFQLALESAIPEALRRAFANGSGVPAFTHLRYEVQVGREEAAGSTEVPKILVENLWLMPRTEETPRGDIVQTELEFPSPSRGDRRLTHRQAPVGWRKVAGKTVNGNSYFRSETTDWNFQIRNPESKSALSTLPEDERFASANWFKRELAEKVQKIMLRSEHMQSPSSLLKNGQFAVDGSNLPQVVRELQRDPAGYTGWIEHLRTVLPLESVQVREREEDRHLFLEVEYHGGLKVKSWHLSDGTLRLLALTLLAYIPDNPSIYLVEEPENGIHPQAIEAVFQSLSSVYDGQVLVATHSPVFVAQVRPEQLLCFSRGSDGATDIVRGDRHPRLRDWRGTLNLSHLYAAGILS